MTAAELISLAAADGVELVATAAGRLRLLGSPDDLVRWLPIAWPYRDQLAAELLAAGQIGPLAREQPAGDTSTSPAPGKLNSEASR
ncbi:MAG: hypothetical protein Q8S20_15690 [Sulfuritalea sp.]|nr:hypothetical protein [Sulfuritalea sp.]